MLYRPLTSIAVIAICAAFGAPVIAQQTCTPAAPSDGDVISCAGTGIGIVDDGLDDATLTVQTGAVITGADQAFEFDDDNNFTNFGTLTGQNDHGMQGDNGNTVINHGTITALGGDGVNIDNDGVVENYGTIRGMDDGVQLEDNATVINHATGEIYADDEGVNINNDDATLTNAGLIEAGDDAVNAARNATITNSGIIRSIGGDQDGIDLDSGTIVNSGTILAVGTQDAIDFDPSSDASTITNNGLIEGHIGINTDPADTGAQTVFNSGTITGRGGLAMDLGAGEDSLEIAGGTINGAVELGAGTDSLIVSEVNTGVVQFLSDPEILDFRIDSVLYDSGALVMLDPALIGQVDLLGAELGYSMGVSALSASGGTGSWVANSVSGGSDLKTGQIAGGHDFGSVGVFAVYSGGDVDGGGQPFQRQLSVGLRSGYDLSKTTRLDMAAYLGMTRLDMGTMIGAEADGQLVGLTAKLNHQGEAGLRVTAQAGVTAYRFSSVGAAALAGATIGSRNIVTGFVDLEMGQRMQMGATTVTPYVGLTGIAASGGDVTMTLGAASASFAPSGKSSVGYLRVGADFEFGSANPWVLRTELRLDDSGEASASVGGALRF